MQILWKDNHHLALLLSPPPKCQKLFATAIHGFNTCNISHTLRMNPVIHENIIEEFWLAAKIVISEAVFREVMGFIDKSTNLVSLEKGVIEGVLLEMDYEGVYLVLQKKLLIPYWRYIAHVFMVSMSGNEGTYDMLNKDQTSAFVALAMN
ncbi:hypothetical protein R6Q57_011586 [Mikania cordata]